MDPRALLTPRTWLALPLLLAAAPTLWADEPPAKSSEKSDVIVLTDGSKLEGTVVGQDDAYVTFRSGGVTRAYPRAEVTSIELGTARSGSEGATSGDGSKVGGDTDGGDKPSSEKRPDKRTERRERKAERNGTTELGDEARQWMRDLVLRAGATDETVRRSVASALVALGAGAIEPLRAELAKTEEEPARKLLESVVRTLEAQAARAGKGDRRPGDGMPPVDRRDAAKRFADKVARELEVSPEQRTKLDALFAEVGAKRNDIVRRAKQPVGTDMPAGDPAADMETLRTDTVTKAKAFLDEGQMVLFEEMAERIFQIPLDGPRKDGRPGKGDKQPKDGSQ